MLSTIGAVLKVTAMVAGFKQIFWLEWVHRLWGRLIGIAFVVPLIWLWVRGAIPRRLVPRLLLLFVLGGLQGAVGWFMVASGFEADTTSVSPYRLVVHLVLALILYAAIVWTGLSALHPIRYRPALPPLLRRLAFTCLALLSLTIVAAVMTLVSTPMVSGKSPVASSTRNTIVNGAPIMPAATAPIPTSRKAGRCAMIDGSK